MVPLLHYDGWSASRAGAARRSRGELDWEDFDLLRVVGRQLASYLAEQASQDALGEAQRFDEFNRRIAFVMHDIKNLASQLALLARNAEKHADNPEFRADMLLTLRNSADKLNALLARLGRYGAQGGEALRRSRRRAGSRGWPRVTRAQHERDASSSRPVHRAWPIRRPRTGAGAPGAERDRGERGDMPVFLDVARERSRKSDRGGRSGGGMSPEFVRDAACSSRSSRRKPGGFGIGAFEARELVRAWAAARRRIARRARHPFCYRDAASGAAGMISHTNPKARSHNARGQAPAVAIRRTKT